MPHHEQVKAEFHVSDSLDAPVLTLNVLMHKRLGLPWGAVSDAMMLATGVSLTFGLLWHVIKMATVKVDDEDGMGPPLLSRSASSLAWMK